jgi:hypothetical protein
VRQHQGAQLGQLAERGQVADRIVVEHEHAELGQPAQRREVVDRAAAQRQLAELAQTRDPLDAALQAVVVEVQRAQAGQRGERRGVRDLIHLQAQQEPHTQDDQGDLDALAHRLALPRPTASMSPWN